MFINNFLSDSLKTNSDPYSLHLLSSITFNPIDLAINSDAYKKAYAIGENVSDSTLFAIRCMDDSYKFDNYPPMGELSTLDWLSVGEHLEVKSLRTWIDVMISYITKFPKLGGNNHSRDVHRHIKEVTKVLCQTVL